MYTNGITVRQGTLCWCTFTKTMTLLSNRDFSNMCKFLFSQDFFHNSVSFSTLGIDKTKAVAKENTSRYLHTTTKMFKNLNDDVRCMSLHYKHHFCDVVEQMFQKEERGSSSNSMYYVEYGRRRKKKRLLLHGRRRYVVEFPPPVLLPHTIEVVVCFAQKQSLQPQNSHSSSYLLKGSGTKLSKIVAATTTTMYSSSSCCCSNNDDDYFGSADDGCILTNWQYTPRSLQIHWAKF